MVSLDWMTADEIVAACLLLMVLVVGIWVRSRSKEIKWKQHSKTDHDHLSGARASSKLTLILWNESSMCCARLKRL